MRRRFQPDCLYLRIFLSPLQGLICSGLTTQGALALRRLPWSIFFSPFQGLGLFHSFTNSFQSATPCALRMSADSGSSFGARGTVSSFRPASSGRRLPFFAFTALLDHTRFSHASLPPLERGTTWSRLPSSGFSTSPVYWQRLPSPSRMVFAQGFGRFFGPLAKFTPPM